MRTAEYMTSDGFLFVTGPPRSGTTYISDWLTQLPDAYCVHEVLTDLRTRPDTDVVAALGRYARTGTDRSGKPRQREFLSWPEEGLQTASPRLLAWKEPVTWGPGGIGSVPDPLRGWLRRSASGCVATIRHPFDVVASGRRRAATTSNWRPLTVEEHCSYWKGAYHLVQDLVVTGIPVLLIKWERLVLDPDQVAARLAPMIGAGLPAFTGYERTPQDLEELRRHVDERRGCPGHPQRGALDDEDIAVIRRCLGDVAPAAGYDLDEEVLG